MSFIILGTLSRYSMYETTALFSCTLVDHGDGLVLQNCSIELGLELLYSGVRM